MRRRLWLVLAFTVVSGCDIDFVAVPDVPPSQGGWVMVMIQSKHEKEAEASLEISVPVADQPPLVLLGDDLLQGEEERGRWWYRTTALFDTLQPGLDLEIQGHQAGVVPLPLLARNGPAIRRPNGDLEIPLVYGRDAADPGSGVWRLALVDSSGHQLMNVSSRSLPLPTPLVVSSGIVPAAAAAAEITAKSADRFDGATDTLSVLTESFVRVPIVDGT